MILLFFLYCFFFLPQQIPGFPAADLSSFTDTTAFGPIGGAGGGGGGVALDPLAHAQTQRAAADKLHAVTNKHTFLHFA